VKRATVAPNPDVYVASLSGWQRVCVENLRAAVRSACDIEERVKWGHLVYVSNGPVLLIRAESERVLFGFWRGQRLRDIEQGLRPGGKYEMATLELTENEVLSSAIARSLVEAVALNKTLGDPTRVSKKGF
jgi:hypothetical protein